METPPKYNYMMSFMDGELRHIFPNIFKHEEENESCRLNSVLVQEDLDCSLLNNIGHFGTILLIIFLFKLLILLTLKFVTVKCMKDYISRVNKYFGLEYLIFLLNSFEIDIILSITVFFFKSSFQSRHYVLEILISLLCLLTLFTLKIIRWTALMNPSKFRDSSYLQRLFLEYKEDQPKYILIVHLISSTCNENLLPFLIILFLGLPLA